MDEQIKGTSKLNQTSALSVTDNNTAMLLKVRLKERY